MFCSFALSHTSIIHFPFHFKCSFFSPFSPFFKFLVIIIISIYYYCTCVCAFIVIFKCFCILLVHDHLLIFPRSDFSGNKINISFISKVVLLHSVFIKVYFTDLCFAQVVRYFNIKWSRRYKSLQPNCFLCSLL